MTERLHESIRRARDWGFIGGDLGQHIEHSLAFVEVLESLNLLDLSGADLGSGGGLPGLVVLTQLPNAKLHLVEIMSKRAAFLESAVQELGFGQRAVVVKRRAEELGHDSAFRESFSFLLARSFAGPGTTAEVGAGLLALDGLFVVSEPPGSLGERWSSMGLDALGLELQEIRRNNFGFAILKKVRPCPKGYPRRGGRAWKLSLF